jgi:hypothetical protein
MFFYNGEKGKGIKILTLSVLLAPFAIRLVTPVTELVVLIYVIIRMKRATAKLPAKGAEA